MVQQSALSQGQKSTLSLSLRFHFAKGIALSIVPGESVYDTLLHLFRYMEFRLSSGLFQENLSWGGGGGVVATLTYKINIDGKGVLTKDIIIDVVGGGG